MPFNIRNMEDEKKARMGVVECVNKKLIEPFQVLFDKEGGYFIFFLWRLGTNLLYVTRFLRSSVQIHSIADAQWTSQNHR